jgi:integrase
MAKSIRDPRPRKPYPTFPLFPHRNGQWAKKILGRTIFFGVWADPEAAYKRYTDQAHNLHNGQRPQRRDRLTVGDLCNRFLTSKKRLHDAGEIADRTYSEYYHTCEVLVEMLGWDKLVEELSPNDFERLRGKLAERWGPVRLGNTMQGMRSVLKYAADYRLVDKPVHFGRSFDRPSKKTLRLARAKKGPRMFEAHEIRAMIDGALLVGKHGPKLVRASQPLRTMILLGVNCGFGNSDVATLPESALDLDGGWVTFPRPKTGVSRRCHLWPETVANLREVLASRPRAKDPTDTGLVFLTKFGSRWVSVKAARVSEKNGNGLHKVLQVKNDDALTKEIRKLVMALGIHRAGLSFYALRHAFETIGGDSRDQVAVNSIMGHVDNSMAGQYRERISDERLEAVTAHVRQWLFGASVE